MKEGGLEITNQRYHVGLFDSSCHKIKDSLDKLNLTYVLHKVDEARSGGRRAGENKELRTEVLDMVAQPGEFMNQGQGVVVFEGLLRASPVDR